MLSVITQGLRKAHLDGVMCFLGGLALCVASASAAEPKEPPSWPPPVERNAAAIFVSGHSLTDRPLPDYIEKIALSLGSSMAWNRQHVFGSSIEVRARGPDPGVSGWPGYRRGENRSGSGMDVVEELRTFQTTGGVRYDILLITEVNVLLGALIGSDTVRMLRHYHDLFVSGNPEGRTFFYEPWLGVLDKSAPQSWIAYERGASPVWRCIATRVNQSLQHAGRKDRITPLPVGLALAELVDHATRGQGIAGITAASARETLDGLFLDDVHLTPRGAYYAALVSYAAIYGRSPAGAWAPSEVDATQAASLQNFAADFVADFYARTRPVTLDACRSLILDKFNAHYWNYLYETYRKSPRGFVGSVLRHIKHWWEQRHEVLQTRRALLAQNGSNPLLFSPEIERTYWHPPP